MTTSPASPAAEDPEELNLAPPRKHPKSIGKLPPEVRPERDQQRNFANFMRESGCVVLSINDKRIIGTPDLFVGSRTIGMWLEAKVMLPEIATNPGPRLKSDLTGEQHSTLLKLDRRPLPAGVLVFMEHWKKICVVPVQLWLGAKVLPRSSWDSRMVPLDSGAGMPELVCAYKMWDNLTLREEK
jgi:hypothetical protein